MIKQYLLSSVNFGHLNDQNKSCADKFGEIPILSVAVIISIIYFTKKLMITDASE